GQSLDATLFAGLDPLDYFVATIAQLMAKQGNTPTADARSATAASRYGVLVVTRDGRFIQTSTLLPHQGRALAEIAGLGHVLDEPRFRRLPMFDNPDDAQAFEDLLIEAFREDDLDHWLPLLLASPDVAFEVAVTSEEGLDHPQFIHNGDVVTITDPVAGPVRQVGPICHPADHPIDLVRSAPALGENAGAFDPGPSPTGGHAAPTHPLSGITIVEFGYFYAMPYGVAMAAALGARVIKIEDASGDPHRMSFGQDVASNKTTAGKESLSLDLRTPEGRAIAQRVVAEADVFITGFRSGVPDKLGLGYDELHAINPRLVYIHASGYGTDGPYALRALYAQAAQAVAGSFGRQVGYWSDPAMNLDMSVPELQAVVIPRLGQVVDGDSNAALIVLASLALAIYDQKRNGGGQFIRTSMISGNAWCYSDDFCTYEGKPSVPLCDDEYYGTAALDRVYPAADGTWVCLVVRTEAEFATLAGVLERPDLATDPLFADRDARAANDDALVKTLGSCFATRTAPVWESMCTPARVGCVAVNMNGHPMFTSFDPGLRESGLTVAFQHPIFGELVRAAPPVTFSETPGRVAPPCVRGQHNRSILAEIGCDDAEIAALEAAGAVIPATVQLVG
ncbi:MAG: putative CoA-transferase, partial [Ilumatobacteraceae bacterium]|nr:putative CoA-transferase [Ilumatobacteraceae bacterium]